MIRISFSTFMMLVFLAVFSTAGHAHEGGTDDNTSADESRFHSVQHDHVDHKPGSDKHDTGSVHVDCASLAHCGIDLLPAESVVSSRVTGLLDGSAESFFVSGYGNALDPPPPRRA